MIKLRVEGSCLFFKNLKSIVLNEWTLNSGCKNVFRYVEKDFPTSDSNLYDITEIIFPEIMGSHNIFSIYQIRK